MSDRSHPLLVAFCRRALVLMATAALVAWHASASEPPDSRVRPGATFILEFPEFGPMHHNANLTGRVEVYIPSDWSPDRLCPLLCWFGPGAGTHEAAVPREISGGKGFVCAGLPYRTAIENNGVSWRIQDGGWGTHWRHYRPMLAEIERVVGNIDPERRAAMGMSSGGAAIGCLIDETKEFTDYFFAFGVAGYGWWHQTGDRLRGRPILLYGGANDGRMNDAQQDVARYKSCGAEPEVIIYPNRGHELVPEYYPQMREWLIRTTYTRGVDAACAGMRAGVAAKRWTAALEMARTVIARTEEGDQRRDEATRALQTIAAAGEEELGRLLGREPSADSVRVFAASWTPCACAARAREHADPLARAELERLAALPAFGRVSKLKKFIEDWDGYPVKDEALKSYEAEAAVALAALEKGRISARALQQYIKKWTPAPSAARALDKLEELAAEALEKILAAPASAQRSRLSTFGREYEGTPSAERAAKALVEILEPKAQAVLEKIKGCSASQQKALLKQFMAQYAGTKAADEARQLLDALTDGK
jgi:hypothetical protein